LGNEVNLLNARSPSYKTFSSNQRAKIIRKCCLTGVYGKLRYNIDFFLKFVKIKIRNKIK
ncbi:MAG: hypothetical protein MRZ90_03650, partial [Candidatus Gastranaerophilales bacterium]|nr:hypothetical protein [Candidatus Gastranaerophilales bacterium]